MKFNLLCETLCQSLTTKQIALKITAGLLGMAMLGGAMLTVETANAATLMPPYKAATPNVNTHRFHEVYYLQPHNTWDHGSTLIGWLNIGFRSVELDVIDKGDWENHSKGPLVSHSGWGGQRNCTSGSSDDRLGHCLQDIMNWLSAHPDSLPLLVLVDMKSSWDWTNAWYGDEIAQLDEWIKNYVGSRLYSYDELYSYVLRRSDYPRTLVAQYGWPTLSYLRGKMIIALTGGKFGSVNQRMEDALIDLYFDYGRYPSTFFCPDVESDPSELDLNGKLDGVSRNNSKFFLCSNLKSRDHYQVTANRAAQNKQIIHLWGDHVYGNTSFTYNYIAVAHGIQAVGQDLSNFFNATTFNGSIPYVGVRRSLPGYFRVRPTDNTSLCMDIEGSYGNGADIHQWTCNSRDDKRFVYTAEGQLRPKGNNKYCADIEGGDAGQSKKMHLWDCDGGNSEKWVITTDGRFRSYDNQSYCMDARASTASGEDWQTYRCGNYDEQKFWLEGIPDWNQTSF